MTPQQSPASSGAPKLDGSPAGNAPDAATKAADGARRVVVLGAGLLGAVLALRLREAGHEVELVEAGSDIGGLAGTMPIGGTTWDRYYHVVLLSDLNTRRLLDELGLADRLRWGTTRTGFFTDGQMHSMSNAIEFLRFPALGLVDKLRLGGTIFLASRIRAPEPLERELATTWLGRWSGRRVLEKIWLPLLRSKLGENAAIASAAFIWAIIARLYAARRSGLKEERFGYIDGGYEVVNRALAERLARAGVRLRLGAEVASIEPIDARQRPTGGDAAGPRLLIRLRDGGTVAAADVIATLAPPRLATLVPSLPVAERSRLANIPYQGIVCAAMLLKKPLSPYYVTNITDPGIPFTGVIEMTALVDRARFGGHSLVYLPLYLAQDAREWHLDDAQVRERFVAAVRRMHPPFDPTDIVDFRVSRARQVLAISTVDYSATWMPPVGTSMPGLHCVNSAQIPYGTLNVNETLGLVERHLPALLKDMTCR
ncbi:MAG: NAD(P)/FAD-dependent oxidoreductase [Lautropia sp.]